MKRIIIAKPRGCCAGVDRAILIVERALEMYGSPVYVRHEVVHNRYVVNDFMSKGVVFIEDLADVPENSVLIYSAHGVPKSVMKEADNRHLKIILDATCPLVSKVHAEVYNLHKNGYHIIMIGHNGHPEVEGTMGQVDGNIYLLESVDDISKLPLNNDHKLAVVTQTTLSVDETKHIIDELLLHYPNLKSAAKR